jgi:hypothetical protein
MEAKQERNLRAHVLQRLINGDWWRILLIWIVTMLLRYGLVCAMLLIVPVQTFAQTGMVSRRPFIAGEFMRYKVKWSFVRLGTVTIRQVPADSGKFLVQMSVQSAPALPFIDVRFNNQTYVTEQSQSLDEETIVSGKDLNEKTVYWFDRKTGYIVMEDSLKGERIKRDSLKWEKECFDALGLLMYSRRFAGSGTTVSLPTLNDYKVDPTEVSYANAAEEIEVDAFDTPRRCYLVSGIARWVGKSFAGMKGPFRGWITDDEAAIPIKAKVEISLGSIVLELESYECPGRSAGTQIADTSSK